MATASYGRSGVLVIRAWVEETDAGRLRARVIRSVDPDGIEVNTVAGSTEEVLAIVDSWISVLLDPDSN